jgi:hypothetical protein
MKKLLLIVLLSMSIQLVKSATITAVQNGNWYTSSTWDLNRVPQCGDVIYIPLGTTVSINADVNLAGCLTPVGIIIFGNLRFQSGYNIRLSCGSGILVLPLGRIIPSPGGVGPGNNNTIVICNVTLWSKASGTVNGPALFGLPLPVELLSFDAKCNDKVIITWSTATETNNDHFTLERSVDSKNWDFVASLKGAGNSNTLLNYQFTDDKSFGGISYYRLSQTDYDGKTEIFSPVSVVCSTAETDDIIMYPNPSKGDLKIQYSNLNEGNAVVKVYDIMGNIILNCVIEVTNGSNYYILDLHDITNGLYNVEFTSGDTRYHQKVLKN